jgi:excisionase family DNA binding protein
MLPGMPDAPDAVIDLSSYPVLLSIAQVAELLGCSVPSVKRRLRERQLASIKEGHHVRIPREALRQYLVARLRPAREALIG